MKGLNNLSLAYFWGKGLISSLLLVSLFFVASACQQQSQIQSPSETQKDGTESQESRLVLNNATLEQSNAEGQTLWKISTKKAIYSKDKQRAKLEDLEGDIFQDGQLVLKVTADKGEVQRDGEEVFLKENIVATDPRNGAVIRTEEVEWRPQEDVLIVKQNLKGSHAKLNVSAKKGKYYSRRERLELIGNIIATTKDPAMQLKTEQLFWEIAQEKVVGHKPIKIVRFKNKVITDQVVADSSEVDLQGNQAKLRQNVEFKSIDPPVQMATNSIIWKYKERFVTSDQPIQLLHYKDRMTISGTQAEVDFNRKTAHVKGGVQGFSEGNQAKLYADNIVWNIANQMIEATGKVIYEQTNPIFNVTGEKAVGNLTNNSLVVSGNNRDRVVTEIYPE